MKMTDEFGEPAFKKCNNPLCDRITTIRSAFCCGACGAANDGCYEIHESGVLGHSDSCNENLKKRGKFKEGPNKQHDRLEDKAHE